MKKTITILLGGAAVAAALAGAPSALADNNTVAQYGDETWSVSGDLHSWARPADMAVRKTESIMAVPQVREELGAIRRSWTKSFCNKAETSHGPQAGSERCSDRDR